MNVYANTQNILSLGCKETAVCTIDTFMSQAEQNDRFLMDTTVITLQHNGLVTKLVRKE